MAAMPTRSLFSEALPCACTGMYACIYVLVLYSALCVCRFVSFCEVSVVVAFSCAYLLMHRRLNISTSSITSPISRFCSGAFVLTCNGYCRRERVCECLKLLTHFDPPAQRASPATTHLPNT